jgi:hypothetical protein
MNISDLNSNKEVALLKKQLKRTHRLCRAIYDYHDYLVEIKEFIAQEDLESASGYWNDLDYDIQKLLITAPLYGGIFTTKERAIVKSLWKISVSDIEENK